MATEQKVVILERGYSQENAITKRKKTTVSFYVDPAITPANSTVLFNAIGGVALGTLKESYLTTRVDRDVGSDIPPTNQFAQREIRWRVSYQDNTNGEIEYREIGTADLTLLTGNGNTLDITTDPSPGKTLKTAIEAHCKSSNGNAITVTGIVYLDN